MNTNNAVISHNNTIGQGAGIYNNGHTLLFGTVIDHNHADANGGGIYNNGQLQIFDTNIVKNKSKTGGGLYTNKLFIEINSTIRHNTPNNIVVS